MAVPALASLASSLPTRLAGLALGGLLAVAGCGGGKSGAADPDDVEQQFTTPEQWATVFDDPARDAWQQPDAVIALLGVEAGMTVVDVGAGTGYFARYLSRAVGPTGRVVATDIDPAMVRYLEKRVEREALSNVSPTVSSATDAKIPPGTARVLIVDTWRFVEDKAGFARQLAAALPAGAVVGVVDLTKQSTKDPSLHLRLEPDAVVADLAAAGFDARVADEALSENFVVLATKK